MSGAQLPEPWLRGDLNDVDAMVAPVLYSFRQVREDLAKWTEGLSDAQVWRGAHGLAPVGFHLKHIAGSIDRLTTYLEGRGLSETQMASLPDESEPGPGLAELLRNIDLAFARAERVFRALDPARIAEPRTIGRKRLPTTVIGLLTHIAEHTQRHLGEAIVTAKLIRAANQR